ncbi:MAG: hypothetical protein U1F76_23865 [Candidatus Competibacteraceae bacterium]
MNADIRGILKQQVTELRRMLLRRINVFEQQVAELKRIDRSVPPVFEEPKIFVCKDDCNFTVMGSGFLPDNIVFIYMSNDDLNDALFHRNIDNSGKFIFTQQTPYVSSLLLHFVSNDGRRINCAIYQQGTDNSGNFTLTQQISQISGLPLHVVATDGRHSNGEPLWSSMVTVC